MNLKWHTTQQDLTNMATKTNTNPYKAGDTIRIKKNDTTKDVKITSIGKAYISCGSEYVFNIDTYKCINNLWSIIGMGVEKPKAKPRGKSALTIKSL